jgi:hypothetical protein
MERRAKIELFETIRREYAAGETIKGLARRHGVHRRMIRQARQISGIVAAEPPSLPDLNCPFLIFSASSIPVHRKNVRNRSCSFFRPTSAGIVHLFFHAAR